ncbi:hypothetical protein QBC38DRAFT_3348 [Podospora fimiseda]|uniref:Dihydrodipicolinate synthase n=1 Tax=Podospora fimiseda TaxID=252190 RepID=A0AAN7H639_9PEZI|nr:hypothetical protein QBC38DRAFT_3348 [Podospora fimiseda]
MSSPIPVQPPPPGIYVPSITIFNPKSQTLDLDSQRKYFTYLAHETGITGLVILGTNAETFLLTREERKALLSLAKECVEGTGVKLIGGVSGHSVVQVREFIEDLVEVGGFGWVLVLPVGYFPGVSGRGEVVEGFYGDVVRMLEGSGIGVVLYNFPGVCNGVDLDSDTIARLADKHDSIVGVKLTCGSVAKITRLAAEFPRERFSVFGGQSDFLIGGLAVGSAGCIAAFGNVFPKTIVKIYDLYQKGERQKALELHQKAALAEQVLKAGGISATKYAASLFTARMAGIEGAEEKMWPRRPYIPVGEEMKKAIRERLAWLGETEKEI